jgi:GrpB-like predicted nucleotidyltransferase (UPF0157 family)
MGSYSPYGSSNGRAFNDPVAVSPYDYHWPLLFEAERTVLQGAIGEWATAGIHHVGSTAIPGVDAQPVIDVMVGVADLAGFDVCVGLLAELGYVVMPDGDPEALRFRKPESGRLLYDLCVVSGESPRFVEMLAFRDVLRVDRQVAIGYAGMKRDLVDRCAGDRRRYETAKAEVIQAVLGRVL